MSDQLPAVEQRLAEIGQAVERIDQREAERAAGRARSRQWIAAACTIAAFAFIVYGFMEGPGRTARFEWWIAQGIFPESERAREMRAAEAFDEAVRKIQGEINAASR